MKNFRALDLAIQYYALVENIKLPHHLREQLLRSASSVSLNLSEGNAKLSYAVKNGFIKLLWGHFAKVRLF